MTDPKVGGQLDNIRGQPGEAVNNFLLSAWDVVLSAAGFVAALVSILTITGYLTRTWR